MVNTDARLLAALMDEARLKREIKMLEKRITELTLSIEHHSHEVSVLRRERKALYNQLDLFKAALRMKGGE